MESVLRLLSRVDIHQLVGGQEALLVVDLGLDDAVPDGFGADVLRSGGRGQVQLLCDVRQGDARVGGGDLAQASLQHIVTQSVGSMNQSTNIRHTTKDQPTSG